MIAPEQASWLNTIAPTLLEGKKVLITGATGGIGMALAQAFYHAGAWVCLSGRNLDALNTLASSLADGIAMGASVDSKATGSGRICHCVEMDLSHTDAIGEFHQRVQDQVGTIDILVNNAGLNRDGLAVRMSDENWRKVIDVNLTSTFFLTRQVLAPMMKQRWGRIITISSVVGFTGNAGQVNYCAAKAGLVGMTKALALEVASRGITANTIAPGYIQTPMTSGLPSEKILPMIPCGRYGLPQDIAPAAVFLASDQASYITGQTIHINGGLATC